MKTDWTGGSAKWGAAILLGVASIGGMAWSLSGNRVPVTVTKGPTQTKPSPIQESPLTPAVPTRTVTQPVTATPEPESAPVIQTAVPSTTGHRVNLNTATQAELELLPGIGPAMAKRILEYRAEHGKFTSVDQLDSVKGIGTKTMAKLRPLISID